MHRYVSALGGAGLLLSVSAIAALLGGGADACRRIRRNSRRSRCRNSSASSDIQEYKALPEYHEPDWVTKKFVDKPASCRR